MEQPINNSKETSPEEPIIEANDITVRFPVVDSPDVYAVKNFNISIKPYSEYSINKNVCFFN